MRAFETEKTDVAEVDRSIYDIKDAANAAFEVNSGLTPDIVAKISEEKHDPEWMRAFRQKSLEIYNKMPVQNWGPSIKRAGYAQYRHLRPPQHRDAGQVERGAGGHQEHL